MRNDVSDGLAGRSARGSAFDDWAETPDPPRDWKKIVLVAGLGILSWVATYIGMLELIESNMGELPLVHRLVIGFSVGMLMIMIIWLLDQLFAPVPFTTKLLYVFGYVFLTAISVGFGFGFYWKVLESRSESSRSAESAVTQVQSALFAATTRLEQLTQTLDQLTAVSRQKAEQERTSGTSCPDSRPGDGPRRKMRDDDAARFGFASDFVKGRATTVKNGMSGLDADLAKIARADASTFDARSGTRNDFMKALSRKLDLTVTGFNAFRTDPQLKQIRSDLGDRAERTLFPDTRGRTYSCPDPQLQAALRGVVRAIDQLPVLEKPKIAAVEGSEATIEAFRRLGATFYGMLILKLPPSADEQRELQKKAVQSVENPQLARRLAAAETQSGLSKRDYVPLAIALFVDLCLLLVSISRPVNRLASLVPKMRAAEQGPVIQILSRFSDIHRDRKMRESFEVLRHVVFDYAGAYYVAVPLDAPYTETRAEQHVDPRTRKSRLVRKQYGLTHAHREELRVEAHLIANLFASFEKDAVFKRVMWLNIDAARKRLQRQGSKFANSEAFRIYRFADGAWSEIILGAVMGAARRVEQRRALDPGAKSEEERPQPTLDTLFDRMRQAETEAQMEHELPRPKPAFDRLHQPRHATAHGLDGTDRSDLSLSPELEAQFGPYASRVSRYGLDVRRRHVHAASTDNDPDGSSQKSTIRQGGAEADPDVDNVVPFKHQPRATGPDEAADPMPIVLARGRADPGAQSAPGAPAGPGLDSATASGAPSSSKPEEPCSIEPVVNAPSGVTVIATERRFSFSLPMNDPRIEGSLYGVADALKGALPAAGTGPSMDPSTQTPTSSPSAAAPPASANSVAISAGFERTPALALPAPTREHEHRG